MKKILILSLLFISGWMSAQAVDLNKENRDPEYVKSIVSRSQKIVDKLGLTDAKIAEDVRNVIANRYFELNDIYEVRDAKVKKVKESGLTGEAKNEACVQGADLSIGSRYVTGVNVVNWPMSRVLLSFFASKYVKIITGMKVHDATAGFVCYTRKVLETINLDKIRFKGYAFQIEMKFTASTLKFRLQEVPIIFTDRTLGTSKMSKGIIKEAVFGVITMKIRALFGKIKPRKD